MDPNQQPFNPQTPPNPTPPPTVGAPQSSVPPVPPPPVVPPTQPSMPPAQPVVQTPPAVEPQPAQAAPSPLLSAQPEPDVKAQKTYASPNPGRSFGIASIVLLFVGMGLLSVIFGVIGLKRSKRAGRSNGLAVAGIILGALEIIAFFVAVAIFGMAALAILETCNEFGSGTHVLTSGQVVTCS